MQKISLNMNRRETIHASSSLTYLKKILMGISMSLILIPNLACSPNGFSVSYLRTSITKHTADSNLPIADLAQMGDVQMTSIDSNKCFDITGASSENGAALQQYDCIGGTAFQQRFLLIPVDNNLYQIIARVSGKCLDVTGISQAPATEIRQSDCGGVSALHQLWSFIPTGAGYQIVAKHSGQCIDVDGMSQQNGVTLRQNICGGATAPHQLWKVTLWRSVSAMAQTGDVQIVSQNSNKCLNILGYSSDNGAPLQQYTCFGPAQYNQLFQLNPIGDNLYQIIARHGGKCLDVTGISQTNGTEIRQSDCGGASALHQLWSFNPLGQGYQIVAKHSGKCLDVVGASLDNEASLQQWDCNSDGARQQIWNLFASDSYRQVSPNLSGSAETTTASISVNSNLLSIATTLHFYNGQGILINHAGARNSLQEPHNLNVATHYRPSNTTYTYSVASVDNSGGVSRASAAATITNGPDQLGLILPDTRGNSSIDVTWTPDANASCTAVWRSYQQQDFQLLGCFRGTSISDQGIPVQNIFWIPQTPPSEALADWLVTKIISGENTNNLTLNIAAFTAVSNAYVQHDDTEALKTYLGSTPWPQLPSGTFYVTSLSIPSSVRSLRGSSNSVIIASAQTPDGLQSGVVASPQAMGFSLSNIGIEAVASSAISGFTLNGGTSSVITNSHFGGREALVLTAATSAALVSYNVIDAWWDNGVFDLGGTSNTYRLNTIKQITGEAGGDVKITGNATSEWNSGIMSFGSNTVIEQNDIYPVGATWGASCQAPGSGCIIRNNHIWYTTRECVTAAQSGFVVSGNICTWKPPGSGKYSSYDFGMSFVSSGSDLIFGNVSGNTLSNTAFSAISIAGDYDSDGTRIVGISIEANNIINSMYVPNFLPCGIIITGSSAQYNTIGINNFYNPTSNMKYNACEFEWNDGNNVDYGIPNNNAIRAQAGNQGTDGNYKLLGAGSYSY